MGEWAKIPWRVYLGEWWKVWRGFVSTFVASSFTWGCDLFWVRIMLCVGMNYKYMCYTNILYFDAFCVHAMTCTFKHIEDIIHLALEKDWQSDFCSEIICVKRFVTWDSRFVRTNLPPFWEPNQLLSPEKSCWFLSPTIYTHILPLFCSQPPEKGSFLLLPETWGPEAEKIAAAEVHATCHRVPGLWNLKRFVSGSVRFHECSWYEKEWSSLRINNKW